MNVFTLRDDVSLRLRSAESLSIDCRLLFLGDNYRRLIRAYEEVRHCFTHTTDSHELFQSLLDSVDICRFYEVRRDNHLVSLVLRDDVFRQAGSKRLANAITLTVRRGPRVCFQRDLTLARLTALGGLLPLLLERNNDDSIATALGDRLCIDESRWAIELVRELKRHGCIQEAQGVSLPRRRDQATVTLLSHACIIFETPESCVITDPLFHPQSLMLPRHRAVIRRKPDAIFLSHAHWDHCNLETLLWFDKATPVFIPAQRRQSAFNPPMEHPLRLLGFSDIRQVEHWKPAQLGDIEAIPVPFHGEQDEPGEHIDHYTYIFKTPSLTVYGGVDSYRDSYGDMRSTLERVRSDFKPDVAFLPVSRMVYEYRHGGVNGFCRRVDTHTFGKSFQYTAGPAEAAEWTAILGVRFVVPYASFTFSQWPAPEHVELGMSLRRHGLAHCFYPLPAGQSVSASHLAGKAGFDLRRLRLVAMTFAGVSLNRAHGWLNQFGPYRFTGRYVRGARDLILGK